MIAPTARENSSVMGRSFEKSAEFQSIFVKTMISRSSCDFGVSPT